MTTSKKDQDKRTAALKKSAGIKAAANKAKPELSDDELKNVTGGAKRKIMEDDWLPPK